MGKIRNVFIGCLILGLLLSGYAVYAGENNSEITNSSQDDTSTDYLTNSEEIKVPEINLCDFIKQAITIVGGTSILGAVASYLGIVKSFKERKCDISSVEIELIQEKPDDIGKYAIFECERISKEPNIFIDLGDESHYLYAITITAICPSDTVEIDNIAIKEFDIEISGYQFIFKPVCTDFLQYKFCGADFREKKCCLLVKLHKAKKNRVQLDVNEVSIFNTPKKCIMHIVFAVNGGKKRLYALWRPKVRTVWFTEGCKDDPSRIVIIKEFIKKGRLSNGFGKV